ncbi:MAG: elongation factor P [Candidatus Limisoma sp.]|nr:elongation factor P [Bacteroidales bacterium]MDD7759749.1 elongation factor P [Bacteroidales bacterium]MDY5894256.1 elongation factor P [Candidatus Limisoma sp.]MDY5900810.1 elongation factor P [Candidatus Limisoma sp.]
MINAQDIKNGTCIRMDGKLYFVIEFLHVKPGKGNTFMRTKLKDVVNGYVLERRFNIGEKLEDVRVEHRPYQYLYQESGDYIFMNQETYEQIPIHKDLITGVDFMKEGDVVDVVSDASTETVLYAEMPIKTQLKITYTEPGLKGDTATNTLKPATVETGATVRVPLFINEGETIEVDTREGTYVSRVKA